MRVHFLTHPEVEIDPESPVVDWSLSERGRERARRVAAALGGVTSVLSSPEVKAEQTAHLIGESLGISPALVGGLAEIDRSATGYLPEPDFWANYQEFMDRPAYSARGWETAEHAQRRIVRTVRELCTEDNRTDVDELCLVSHGGVGALLLCELTGTPIQRLQDQPGQGSHFSFDAATGEVLSGWAPFEALTGA